MRVHVLQELIEILRQSGYPSYESTGVNAPARVAQRLEDRYASKYGTAAAVQNIDAALKSQREPTETREKTL